MFLDLSTEGSDLGVLFFNHTVESLALLAKSGQFVVAIIARTLECVL